MTREDRDKYIEEYHNSNRWDQLTFRQWLICIKKVPSTELIDRNYFREYEEDE